MAGKRKRADTLGVGEVEEGQMNGGGQVNQHEKFREWLADVMEILRELGTLDKPLPPSTTTRY